MTATVSHTWATTARSCDTSTRLMPRSLLQLVQQVEHLGLDVDVERRRGLVGDQQRRVLGEGDRQQDPLQHPARELERVLVEDGAGVAQPHASEQLDGPVPRGAAGQPGLDAQHLDELAADRDGRVEVRAGVLEHGRDRRAAQRTPLVEREVRDVGAVDADASAARRVPTGRMPSAARHVSDLPLPDSPTMPSVDAALQLQRDAADQLGAAVGDDVEVLDRQDGVRRAQRRARWSWRRPGAWWRCARWS